MPSAEPCFICTEGGIQTEVQETPGTISIAVSRGSQSEIRSFGDEPSPFARQAQAFLDSLETRQEGRNPPDDAAIDLRIAAAISISAREHRGISLKDSATPARTDRAPGVSGSRDQT